MKLILILLVFTILNFVRADPKYTSFTISGKNGCVQEIKLNECDEDLCGTFKIIEDETGQDSFEIHSSNDETCASIVNNESISCLADSQKITIFTDYTIVCHASNSSSVSPSSDNQSSNSSNTDSLDSSTSSTVYYSIALLVSFILLNLLL